MQNMCELIYVTVYAVIFSAIVARLQTDNAYRNHPMAAVLITIVAPSVFFSFALWVVHNFPVTNKLWLTIWWIPLTLWWATPPFGCAQSWYEFALRRGYEFTDADRERSKKKRARRVWIILFLVLPWLAVLVSWFRL
jgi:hypothetical protein